MRLLFIYYDGVDYHGGPIVHARRLLPELQRRGHEIHCLIFHFDGVSPAAEDLRRHDISCRLYPFNVPAEEHVAWILAQVADIAPDIFVPNLSVAGFYAARWVRPCGIPTVAVHRSHDDFHRAMVEQFIRGDPQWACSGLVCVAEDLRAGVQEAGAPRTRLVTIPSGVPICAQASTQSGPLKLVYAGRLNQEQKRIHDLIDALVLPMRRRGDITATLIGTGRERSAILGRIRRHGLEDRITLRGGISGDRIQQELVQYHALVLLSDFEGTPIAVMDGMAAGLVPVCLDIPGGTRELVIHERTGLLVRDRAGDFENAVLRLAEDVELRRRLASAARAHVSAHFSIRMAADRWETLCRELVADAGPRLPLVPPGDIALPPPRAAFAREDRRRSPPGGP